MIENELESAWGSVKEEIEEAIPSEIRDPAADVRDARRKAEGKARELEQQRAKAEKERKAAEDQRRKEMKQAALDRSRRVGHRGTIHAGGLLSGKPFTGGGMNPFADA